MALAAPLSTVEKYNTSVEEHDVLVIDFEP
ncbi:hypothetical protein AGR8A_Cc60396 [Agrobacterium fabrum str. J-07]|nr:hypothetical protein AGR8A_Cc60396 [Agrobacterium fabrum str. J-07]